MDLGVYQDYLDRSHVKAGDAPADLAARTELTPARWALLNKVNTRVNDAIVYLTDQENYGQDDFWADPLSKYYRGRHAANGKPEGDCEDFAIAKRRQLIEAGWPADTLALASVGGIGMHSVLVARTDHGDLVLDIDQGANVIRQWHDTPYFFHELQFMGKSALVHVDNALAHSMVTGNNGSLVTTTWPDGKIDEAFGLTIGLGTDKDRENINILTGTVAGKGPVVYSANDAEANFYASVRAGKLKIGVITKDKGSAAAALPILSSGDGQPTLLSTAGISPEDLRKFRDTAAELGIAWNEHPNDRTVEIPGVSQLRDLAKGALTR